MKAVILARVSTEEQKDAGNSLPAQIDRLTMYCKQKGLTIVDRFSIDESAYKKKRDDFDSALQLVKSSKEKIAVCFDKVDRFSRDVFDRRVASLYDLAMEGKIELHFASDNLVITSDISAVEKFHFGINLGLAKYFSDAISDNTKRAFEKKLRAGECIGPAPLGYLNVPEEKAQKKVISDPEKAHHIVRVFELYATSSYSIKTLRDEIIKAGLRSRQGKKPTTSLIYHILTNPFYYGVQKKKGKLYPHIYPPLIRKDLFDKVQGVLQSANKKVFKYRSKPFALRGLVRCSNCGCLYTPELKKGKYKYYSCTNYKGICKRRRIREEKLLKPIIEDLKRLQVPQERVDRIVADLKALNENKSKYYGKMLVQLESEYCAVQKRLDNLLDLLADGSITKDDYDRKLKEYKEKQYDLSTQLEQYTKADEDYHITASTVFSLANRASEIFESSEPEEKRQLLKYLLQNCTFNGKKLVYKLKAPYQTMLSAANHPNWLRGSDSNRRPTGYI